jgi:hypothetical protein
MITRTIGAVLMILVLTACSPSQEQGVAIVAAPGSIILDIYKSPSCGCCGVWVEHMQERGFGFVVHHRDNDELTLEKLRRGIPLRYHSCHTAVAADGSVFEGHIPAHLIHEFLAAIPADAMGLAVPGMPIGSPGMEAGQRLDPYDVFMIRRDGTAEVFAHVTDFQSQYQ